MTDFRVTTICGSMKFYKDMLEAAAMLSKEAYVVIMPFVTFTAEEQLTRVDKKMLDEMHFFKIDMSDEIHVVSDKYAYVGWSTTNEIEHANKTGKKVTLMRFHEGQHLGSRPYVVSH